MGMQKSDDEIFLDEVVYSVKARDFIKTKILLRESSSVSMSSTGKLIEEILLCEDSFSIPLLVYIMIYQAEISTKVPDLELTLQKRLCSSGDLWSIFQVLTDLNEKCCFIDNLVDRDDEEGCAMLIKLVREETDLRIIKSVLKVMAEQKRSQYAPFIADFLYSENHELVSQALETLGSCATDLAVDAMVSRSGADSRLDRQIVDNLKRIASDKSIKALVNFLSSGISSLRNNARKVLAELKEISVPYLLDSLHSRNPNIVIVTLNILGETGVREAVKPVRQLIQSMPEDANIRFAAYEALGLLPCKTGAYTLTHGLLDSDEGVRTAAAKAVNQQYDHLFERGVLNLFEIKENRELITDALLTAESNRVISSMVHNPDFHQCAVKILKARREKDLIEFYMGFAKNINLSCDISLKKKVSEKPGKNAVYVVDDSRLLLKIYRKFLTELNVDFHLFEFAEAALDQAAREKPSLILTDLNMPGMDGIEFTGKVRELYSEKELPIVMVTTQDEEADRSAALKAGVQDYLHKPFNKSGIEMVLKRYLK